LHASAWTLELIESLTMLTPLLRRLEATRAETTARIKAMVGLRQRSPAWPECSASPPISNLALTSDQPEPDHQNMSSPSDIPAPPDLPADVDAVLCKGCATVHAALGRRTPEVLFPRLPRAARAEFVRGAGQVKLSLDGGRYCRVRRGRARFPGDPGQTNSRDVVACAQSRGQSRFRSCRHKGNSCRSVLP
jgi:hypothetical protein